ncbi:unnamed protein product [Adineta steineri]|uniref:Uncharacterized protein n=1 Tax=Adineta steineri TaxID=433720 RepID=A0A813PF13_9BILA|nr:unnamed protein product [Adineta steineri]CAF0752502.1 unnamed protein product [Adineta steineri]CAF0832479.1 unnamed protein product [Adineta steineri]
MDKKKSSASASSSHNKTSEKKEENFFTKTAHSIRDKVHDLTDEVKEKTHNLTHSNAKKDKKDSIPKAKDGKPNHASKPAASGKKGSSSDSSDEDGPPKTTKRPSLRLEKPKDNARDTGRGPSPGSKPPPSTTISDNKSAAAPTSSKRPADKPSDDHKDSHATARSSDDKSAEKPSVGPSSTNKSNDPAKTDDKSTTKISAGPSTTNKPNDSTKPDDKSTIKTSAGPSSSNKTDDTTKRSSAENDNNDRVHLSFDGVSTVDDLLDRIDEAIEGAKIILEGDKSKTNFNIGGKIDKPRPTPADLERKPLKKSEDKNKVATSESEDENEDEPIRINYNDIHRIEDLLLLIHKQPGNRNVVLENAPDDSVLVQKNTNQTSTVSPSTSKENEIPPIPTTPNEDDDPLAPQRSILKSSQDPSSSSTSTKTASFDNDQIHVDIEGVQNLDNLLERIDNAVENVPVIIDTKPEGEKRQAPQPPIQTDTTTQVITKVTIPSQKREAPKPPSSTNNKPLETKLTIAEEKDHISQSDTKEKNDAKVASIKVPEHEFHDDGNHNINKQASSLSTNEENKNNSDTKDWL